jgi:two-component system response regulator AtoC
LLDILMPNRDGFETLREIRQINRDLPVIMLSGMSTPSNIVRAMKFGATDFLPKPIGHEDLSRIMEKVTASYAASGQDQLHSVPAADEDMLVGTNAAMRRLCSLLSKVAASDVPIIIQGETGTGKEVLARKIHALSERADKPFIKLNCAAVPSDLMESEMFGYERGAFTGAFQRKLGLFELADGGTILLDEIGDLDIRLQAKLLQVLQDHEFRRLGGRDNVRVKVRVIAATHRDLMKAFADGRFRQDLYYRLNVVTLTVPPLRAREGDIVSLAEFLIRKHSSRDVPPVMLTPRLKAALCAYDWPGNIRQLENLARKLMVLRDAQPIIDEIEMLRRTSEKSRAAITETHDATPLPETTSILERVSRAKQDAEAEAILEALNASCWNRKQASAMLNIDYKALLYKMKKLSIEERGSKAQRAKAAAV